MALCTKPVAVLPAAMHPMMFVVIKMTDVHASGAVGQRHALLLRDLAPAGLPCSSPG